MRALADAERIRRFMRALGAATRGGGGEGGGGGPARVYFTGGASAVLAGWRPSTIDVDIKMVPEDDDLLRAIPDLKERLQINVELASPVDFIPVAPGWEDRSPFITQEGRLAFHHFEFPAQALAKIERGHAQDLEDVHAMVRAGLIDADQVRRYFARIAPELYRYPAITVAAFRRSVEEFLAAAP